MGLARMPSKVRPACPAHRLLGALRSRRQPVRCAQLPWQVLPGLLTLQGDAGALHVVSWLMHNFKMEVWYVGWKCGFILCVYRVLLSPKPFQCL